MLANNSSNNNETTNSTFYFNFNVFLHLGAYRYIYAYGCIICSTNL